jgi:hypothetical protein
MQMLQIYIYYNYLDINRLWNFDCILLAIIGIIRVIRMFLLWLDLSRKGE